MNRLILVGNGFDMAHGLKTSYNNFIEYLWCNIHKEFLDIIQKNGDIYGDTRMPILEDKNKLIKLDIELLTYEKNCINIVHSKSKISKIPNIEINFLENDRTSFCQHLIKTIKSIPIHSCNTFFYIISDNYVDIGWSDIEADYYKHLIYYKDQEDEIEKLNKDFEQIKKLLKVYLSSLDKPKKIEGLEDIIYSSIKVDDTKVNSADTIKIHIENKLPETLSKESNSRLISALNLNWLEATTSMSELKRIACVDTIFNSDHREEFRSFLLPNKILMLNFNYTDTENLYVYKKGLIPFKYGDIEVLTNHIHGTIDEDSSIIFGYGDEDDDEYKDLEKIKTKGLLDNVKSINYLKTSNYRDLERFIESDHYQIFIMGMSCGMADRTILRKLFQHKNCISIKPFYHIEFGEDNVMKWDNHTELIQNIVRCFNDKDLLRSTVVNKKYCSTLPQCKKAK